MTGPSDPKKLARTIETELERAGSPERAASEKRYFKSDMDFLGATLPTSGGSPDGRPGITGWIATAPSAW